MHFQILHAPKKIVGRLKIHFEKKIKTSVRRNINFNVRFKTECNPSFWW